jgi:hypothetical protein
MATIRSLFRYTALRHPEHAEVIARVLDRAWTSDAALPPCGGRAAPIR